jgi:hypothetical protein
VQSLVVSNGKLKDSRPKNLNPPAKTKSNGAAPAHTRSKVRRKRGRDNVADEVEKLQIEVATGLRVALRALVGSTLIKFRRALPFLKSPRAVFGRGVTPESFYMCTGHFYAPPPLPPPPPPPPNLRNCSLPTERN